MALAALITWLVTALGGFYMLGIWISRGGARQQQTGGASRLPVPVVFGHFALAAAGLVVWIIYLVTDKAALAWTAFGLLVPVALLGFTMLARWLPVRGADAAEPSGAGDAERAEPPVSGDAEPAEPPVSGDAEPAERHFPVPVVVAHGLFAVATVVLVLLTALGIGGS